MNAQEIAYAIRLREALAAEKAGDIEGFHRILGIPQVRQTGGLSSSGMADPSRTALNEARTDATYQQINQRDEMHPYQVQQLQQRLSQSAEMHPYQVQKIQQGIGYHNQMDPLTIGLAQQRLDQNAAMFPEQLLGQQLRNDQAVQTYGYNALMNPVRYDAAVLGNGLKGQTLDYNTSANPLRLTGMELGNERKAQQLLQADARFAGDLAKQQYALMEQQRKAEEANTRAPYLQPQLEAERVKRNLDNNDAQSDYIHQQTQRMINRPTTSTDKKEIDGIKASNEINAAALGNRIEAVLVNRGIPVTKENIQSAARALGMADLLPTSNNAPLDDNTRAVIGTVMDDQARQGRVGGTVYGDGQPYMDAAKRGFFAISGSDKTNPYRSALGILGENALTQAGQAGALDGGWLSGTFGNRHGPLDNDVMDAVYKHAASQGGDAAQRLSMMYANIPTILEKLRISNPEMQLKTTKDLVENFSSAPDPDAAWAQVLKQVYDNPAQYYMQPQPQ